MIQVQSPVISVDNLGKRFNLEAGFFAPLGRFINAVNGVSFSIKKNETYGLVGESGCGKTTTARLLVRMYEADTGDITFLDQGGNALDVRKLKGPRLKRYREQVKYIFQDPARSLNPRMTVYETLSSGTRWSTDAPAKGTLREEAARILEEAGLSAADMERRPGEFSGGQRQRISIARGLMMKPKLLIGDEVVSALDVSIQGQILNLLLDIRDRREISFLFIAHDLKVASYFCDRIGVMFRGELMEEAPARVLGSPGSLHQDSSGNRLHPYTELLFSSAGIGTGPEKQREEKSPRPSAFSRQEIKSVRSETEGCSFASRCPYGEEICFKKKPELKTVRAGHLVRCWRHFPEQAGSSLG
jgi:oligopeptide/dipeptide ABC transporter ATP-binding protein